MMYYPSWKVRVVALRELHVFVTLVWVSFPTVPTSELAMTIQSARGYHKKRRMKLIVRLLKSVRAVIAGYAATSPKRRRHA